MMDHLQTKHALNAYCHDKIFVGKLSLLNQKLSLCPTLTHNSWSDVLSSCPFWTPPYRPTPVLNGYPSIYTQSYQVDT